MPSLTERRAFTIAREADVDYLRGIFESGAALPRDRARSLGMNDRRFRLAISELRRRGYPVVSVSEEGSVYRRALSLDELTRFIEHELESRAHDLLAQGRSMRAEASSYFAPEQERLRI